MATIAEAVNQLVSLRSCNQETPINECGGSTEKCNEKENLELQGEEKELEHELQQEEVVEIIGIEEVVGELREIDQEVDFIINDFLSTLTNPLDDLVEHSPIEFGFDVEVDFT
ncbi:hypothetical protein AHAS_Ahas13G0316600 [Arachis hypogaea]